MSRRIFVWTTLCTVLFVNLTVRSDESTAPPEPSQQGAKVPVALAWDRDGSLLVALRDGQKIVSIDPAGWHIKSEWLLPLRPTSMIRADDQGTLLVGGMDGQVVILGADRRVLKTLVGGQGPARLLPLSENRVAVASLWDSSVRVWDWKQATLSQTHRLPFAPAAMVQHPDGRIIVADAFGGKLATLRPGALGTEHIHDFGGVNLHALAISGDRKELLIAHMFQFDEVPITNSNIDWGLVLSSKLSAVRLADLDVDPKSAGELPHRRLTLDGSVHGAADPSAIALAANGAEIFLALEGAHQVLKSQRNGGTSTPQDLDLLPLGHNQRLEVVEVGRSPVALLVDPTDRFVITADSMSDSLTVLDRKSLSRIKTVNLSPQGVSPTLVQRGEAFFRDGRRSLDRWMSCASCHPSGHTTGLNFDTQGDGGHGAPKNTPSLLGIANTEPFTWVGTFSKLGEQVHQSFVSSLKGRPPATEEIAEVVAYLESLPPIPRRVAKDDARVQRGAELFQKRRCDQCHRPPLYTSAGLRDVGLDDESGGHTRFNPPSLRGLTWTAPYLHDGRSQTLHEVLQIHPPKASSDAPLTPADTDALVEFLLSL